MRHVLRIIGMENLCKVFVLKPEGKRFESEASCVRMRSAKHFVVMLGS